VVAAAARWTVGEPTDEVTQIGPMASEAHRERVNGYIEPGIADGAKLDAS
jgi:aldehyde dehydrogenase (NAD+)